MKIGIFDPYLDTLGGGEAYMLTIASCLSKRHEIYIFWDDKLILKKAHDRFLLDLSGVSLFENIFSTKHSFLKRFLVTRRFDCIFFLSDGSIPLLFAKKNILLFQFPVNWINGKNILTRAKFLKISKILCYSRYVKTFLDKAFPLKAIILSPSVNMIQEDNIKKEDVILTVGRFTKAINTKKHEVLIDAFKKMCMDGLWGWQFVVIGSVLQSDKDFVRQLVQRAKGYPIHILENISYSNLVNHYKKAKIYWHCAGWGEDLKKHPERAEHFGISTVEAMGAGAVPVVINAGGQKEIVEDQKNGFLWNSTEELIEKTNILMEDRKLWENMSSKARIRARVFNKERFCKELETILL